MKTLKDCLLENKKCPVCNTLLKINFSGTQLYSFYIKENYIIIYTTLKYNNTQNNLILNTKSNIYINNNLLKEDFLTLSFHCIKNCFTLKSKNLLNNNKLNIFEPNYIWWIFENNKKTYSVTQYFDSDRTKISNNNSTIISKFFDSSNMTLIKLIKKITMLENIS